MQREELAEQLALCRLLHRAPPPRLLQALRACFLQELADAPTRPAIRADDAVSGLCRLLEGAAAHRGTVRCELGTLPRDAAVPYGFGTAVLAALHFLGIGEGSRIAIQAGFCGGALTIRLTCFGERKTPPHGHACIDRWAAAGGGMILWYHGRGVSRALMRLPAVIQPDAPRPRYEPWLRDRYSPLYAFAAPLLVLPG